jgi:hypothetical protein
MFGVMSVLEKEKLVLRQPSNIREFKSKIKPVIDSVIARLIGKHVWGRFMWTGDFILDIFDR